MSARRVSIPGYTRLVSAFLPSHAHCDAPPLPQGLTRCGLATSRSARAKTSAVGLASSESACERVLLRDWSVPPEHVEAFGPSVEAQKCHQCVSLK